MAVALEHPFDMWRKQWRAARRRAAAGSKEDAILCVIFLYTFLDANVIDGPDQSCPPGLPRWLMDDLEQILQPTMRDGSSLDSGFHLKRARGRSVMTNLSRDMEISNLAGAFATLEEFADAADRLDIPSPTPGEPWTADALAKAIKAHHSRIKSGLLFLSPDD